MEEEPKYSWQQCQDEELDKEFSELHKKIVNEVIAFCKEHNLEIDEFHLGADGVKWFIQFGKWTPATDSSFSLNRNGEEKPVLWSL